MIYDVNHLGAAITAIGALGTSAAGLVDAFKVLPKGGVSNFGYRFIHDAIKPFIADSNITAATILLDTLHANWINGNDLDGQKSKAKSLIKLHLTPDNAQTFCNIVGGGLDASKLADVAQKMSTGDALSTEESNALGRFDLALSSLIDEAYQHADQRYRNGAKLVATIIAVVLALTAGLSNYYPELDTTKQVSFGTFTHDMLQWLIAGLLATPLAPMAKDLASALSTASQAVQSLRK
ncbi:hypothetical protein [Chromobacterium violaceum]|uniref:hypothetical protein n=1 Tax=Chromobacterium violaceum TaxID=536 RepID=UPI001CE0B738|nr:hypothetical protein [Chromobacterium violaceum]